MDKYIAIPIIMIIIISLTTSISLTANDINLLEIMLNIAEAIIQELRSI